MTIRPEDRISRKNLTAKQAAQRAGMSVRSAQRWTSRTRDEYIADMAAEREAIRAYHDDEGHSLTVTAKHFKVSVSAIKQRVSRARRERAADAEEAAREPMLPLDEPGS